MPYIRSVLSFVISTSNTFVIPITKIARCIRRREGLLEDSKGSQVVNGPLFFSQRLRHTINFSDESTPGRRGKPGGVTGCEIWVKIGDPAPTDPKELHFVAMDTASPYVRDYDGADANKVAHYMLRWVNRKGETGPWSQTVSATITG